MLLYVGFAKLLIFTLLSNVFVSNKAMSLKFYLKEIRCSCINKMCIGNS
jgi:hypothetical protein